MHTRQDEKSFRTGDRDERSNKDACPLRGLRERGQKDVRVLTRLVRTPNHKASYEILWPVIESCVVPAVMAWVLTRVGMEGASGRTRHVNRRPLDVPPRYGQGYEPLLVWLRRQHACRQMRITAAS